MLTTKKNLAQEIFHSIFSTLQKLFNGAIFQLKTKKTEIKSIARKKLMVCDIQLPMDSKFIDDVKFFVLF